jgi:hypothetical protein
MRTLAFLGAPLPCHPLGAFAHAVTFL